MADLKMQDVFVTFFLMLTTAPCLRASDGFDDSQFVYDYESLKMVGLIIAGILCAMGIIILLSGKCRCKFNKQNEPRHRAQEQQLIAPGSASRC
ncbi:FXYD domain-containing ion transport regulator 3-like [Rana temporaria]|uniref:FXYD domain-containing ion transport regulator 3-like n=1 Tax=Rana temporaria TaxID=8407 RepID=UPI001AAD3E54|nr:FXYD domain-containing ion transport regulator 3-like [Rana temporaria]